MKVTLFQIDSFRYKQVKIKSYGIRVGPNQVRLVSYKKREIWTQTQREIAT